MRSVIGSEFQLGDRVSLSFFNRAIAFVLVCIETAISYVRFVLLSRTSVLF